MATRARVRAIITDRPASECRWEGGPRRQATGQGGRVGSWEGVSPPGGGKGGGDVEREGERGAGREGGPVEEEEEGGGEEGG